MSCIMSKSRACVEFKFGTICLYTLYPLPFYPLPFSTLSLSPVARLFPFSKLIPFPVNKYLIIVSVGGLGELKTPTADSGVGRPPNIL